MAITDTHNESATAEAPKTKKRRKQHVRQAPTLAAAGVYLRVPDLIAIGIIKSWTDLVRLIAEHGFPAGILLSPKVRVWTVEEVKGWLDSRPVKIERHHLHARA